MYVHIYETDISISLTDATYQLKCGEEKCVALTFILPRLMEEKADTVLKGTLSFLDTGSSENKLQHFQLHLKRANTLKKIMFLNAEIPRMSRINGGAFAVPCYCSI